MEMRLVGYGMTGLAILISYIFINYRKNRWLKASQSSRQPLEFARVVLLESTLSISSIGGRQAEHHASWDWYIQISVVPCLSHPWMDKGMFWFSLMTFPDTHGSFLSKRSRKSWKNSLNWRPWLRMHLAKRSRSWDMIMAGSVSVMSYCIYVPKVVFNSNI